MGHRLLGSRTKKQLELEVKWEGYDETTWEIFEDFVKDTPNEVEKYLVRNVLTNFTRVRDARDELK